MGSCKHDMILKWSNCWSVSWDLSTSWGIEDNHACNFVIKLLEVTDNFNQLWLGEWLLFGFGARYRGCWRRKQKRPRILLKVMGFGKNLAPISLWLVFKGGIKPHIASRHTVINVRPMGSHSRRYTHMGVIFSFLFFVIGVAHLSHPIIIHDPRY